MREAASRVAADDEESGRRHRGEFRCCLPQGAGQNRWMFKCEELMSWMFFERIGLKL